MMTILIPFKCGTGSCVYLIHVTGTSIVNKLAVNKLINMVENKYVPERNKYDI